MGFMLIKRVINSIFVFLLIIIIFISLSFVVLFNLTPAQIGFSLDYFKDFNMKEIELADIKLGNFLKDIIVFNYVKENDMVQNNFSKIIEEKHVQSNFKESRLDGKKDFSSLIINRLTYPTKKVLTYSDRMLAYIFDNIFNNLLNKNNYSALLKGIKISVGEISIFTENSSAFLRVVYHADINNLIKEIESRGIKVSKFFPKKIYLENCFSMNVNEKGKAILEPLSFTINNRENNFISRLIKSYILKTTGFDSEYEMNLQLGKIISDVIFNLGSIGLAENNKTDNLSDLTFGISAVFNHGITVITHDNVTSKS